MQNALNTGKWESIPDLADPDHCALGRWLHDEGRQLFGAQAEYADLVVAHTAVHRLVREALDQRVNTEAPDPALERRLDQASTEFKRLLQLLQEYPPRNLRA